jgi:hypothetical protein
MHADIMLSYDIAAITLIDGIVIEAAFFQLESQECQEFNDCCITLKGQLRL